MHVAVACVIPDVLCTDIHGITVTRVLVMGKSVRGVVASAAHITAYQADPEIGCAGADGAGGFCIRGCFARARIGECEGRGLRVATYWTAGASPFLQAGAVEDVLAEDGEKTGRFVHSFQTDGASR